MSKEESTPGYEIKIMNPMIGNEFPLPCYEVSGSAAIDLRACVDESVVIGPMECKVIGSGIAIDINDPFVLGTVVPRSGKGVKEGVVVGNLTGYIDHSYQGEIMIGCWNRNPDRSVTIERGERIAQMAFVCIKRPVFNVVSEFSVETERGTSGLGSSGSF